jgi:hypothetical protein
MLMLPRKGTTVNNNGGKFSETYITIYLCIIIYKLQRRSEYFYLGWFGFGAFFIVLKSTYRYMLLHPQFRLLTDAP